MPQAFGKPEVLHLPFLDQIFHRARHLLDGHVRIHPVLVEHVYGVDPQSIHSLCASSHASAIWAGVARFPSAKPLSTSKGLVGPDGKPEETVLPTLEELGIGFVPFSLSTFENLDRESESPTELKPWLPAAHLTGYQIVQALANNLGHIGKADRELGVCRRTMQRRMNAEPGLRDAYDERQSLHEAAEQARAFLRAKKLTILAGPALAVSLEWWTFMRFCFSSLSVLIMLSSAAAQEGGDPRLGLGIAREDCAACHAVLRVEDRSPNPNAPTFGAIANVPGMTATALHVALQSPHKTMPNVMLEPDELGNLIAYILTLKARQ